MTKGAKPLGEPRKVTDTTREFPDHIRIDDHHNSQCAECVSTRAACARKEACLIR